MNTKNIKQHINAKIKLRLNGEPLNRPVIKSNRVRKEFPLTSGECIVAGTLNISLI